MPTLADPLRRLLTEVTWLREEFHAASARTPARREQLTAEMAVIRMHDAWARYCRELVILSASGDTLTLSGVVVPAAIKRRMDVIPTLLAAYPRKRWFEPKWASAAECIGAAKLLKIANLATLAGALGATNSPAEEIRNVRNYYAHRGQGTAARAIACRVFIGHRPIVFDLTAYRNPGETYMDSWTNGLILVATSASL